MTIAKKTYFEPSMDTFWDTSLTRKHYYRAPRSLQYIMPAVTLVPLFCRGRKQITSNKYTYFIIIEINCLNFVYSVAKQGFLILLK